MAATPPADIVLALLCSAASYACLTLFDWLGLRYIRRPLPFSQVALVSFIGVSIGHSVGFSALSSGAIRYRFYTRWGLTLSDVAKLVVFGGFTVGLGLLTLSGLVLLWEPEATARLLPVGLALLRGFGLACLGLSFLYPLLVLFLPQPFRIHRWIFEPPSVQLALLQVLSGTANFTCVAGCLYFSLRSITDVSALEAATAYVFANVATMMTHVPGGLGVIESVVTSMLPHRHLIGAVLIFRAVYFLVPLALGGLTLLVAETVVRRHDAAAARGRT